MFRKTCLIIYHDSSQTSLTMLKEIQTTSRFCKKTRCARAKNLEQCVRVCLYSSTVKVFSVCKMSKAYLRVLINGLVLWILVGCFMPSSKISVSENIIFHLQRRKLQPNPYWRENNMIKCAPRKGDIYWRRT